MMIQREYKIPVVKCGSHYHASLYELECHATGATAQDVLDNLRMFAEDVLRDCEKRRFDPPQPGDIKVVTLQFPAPVTKRGSAGASAA